VIVGLLFISATVTSIFAGSIVEEIIKTPTDLVNIAGNENLMITAAIITLIGAISVFSIPAIMFPILKKQNESLALSYFGFRTFEAVLFIVDMVGVLALVSLSQEYMKTGVLSESYLALSTLILAVRDWGFLLVPIVFGTGALLFYYLLFKANFVPRWLSGWGFIGAALVFIAGLMGLFGNFLIYLALPIAVQEMVLAAWLIIKGFNLSE
jgi:hypothetical protein